MTLCDFFVDGGPLAAALGDGYKRREEQVRMAVEVGRCAGGEVDALLADAKTGTGKSLAYLCPLALAGGATKVVVSTATKALQHQLVEKDLPALCKALRAGGLKPPTYALLKGRSNFLCQARHDNVLAADASDAPPPAPRSPWPSGGG